MNWIGIGTLLAFFGVALGAFGAHALQDRVEPHLLEIFKTSTHYFMIHSIALVLFGLFRAKKNWSGWCFLMGILIFSGSLYTIVFTGARAFGAITPIGGVLFMAGWIGFAFEAGKRGSPG
ncbi:MAG: DUF423 domain-containing protein [Bdellovibrionales bacterium]|nr:DUF423 domain-containing protein [Bdellovibrionales bacterium]